jgi:hypothetical protein
VSQLLLELLEWRKTEKGSRILEQWSKVAGELEGARAEIAGLREKLKETELAKEQLLADMSQALGLKEEELAAMERRRKEDELALLAADKAKMEAVAEAAVVKKSEVDVIAFHAEISLLKKMLCDTEAEASRLQGKVSDAEAKITKDTVTLTEMEATLAEVQRTSDELELQLEDERSKYLAALEVAWAETRALKAEVDALQSEVAASQMAALNRAQAIVMRVQDDAGMRLKEAAALLANTNDELLATRFKLREVSLTAAKSVEMSSAVSAKETEIAQQATQIADLKEVCM